MCENESERVRMRMRNSPIGRNIDFISFEFVRNSLHIGFFITLDNNIIQFNSKLETQLTEFLVSCISRITFKTVEKKTRETENRYNILNTT
jgi:hypothetical protein